MGKEGVGRRACATVAGVVVDLRERSGSGEASEEANEWAGECAGGLGDKEVNGRLLAQRVGVVAV